MDKVKKRSVTNERFSAPLPSALVVDVFFMANTAMCQNQSIVTASMRLTSQEAGEAHNVMHCRAMWSFGLVPLYASLNSAALAAAVILFIVAILAKTIRYLIKVEDESGCVYTNADDSEDLTEENTEVERNRSAPAEMHEHIVSDSSSKTCRYCGVSHIHRDASFCWNCGASLAEPRELFVAIGGKEKKAVRRIGKCIVCNLGVESDDATLWCPYCGNVAHRTHMLEWLHVKDYCPTCRKHLEEKDLKAQPTKRLPGKRRSAEP